MYGYLIKRLCQGVILLFVLASVTFFLFEALPGNPVDVMIGPGAPHGVREALIARFGFDQPIFTRYTKYLNNLLHGDLGWSYVYFQPVENIIKDKLIYTAALFLPSAVLAYAFVLIGIPFIVLKRGSWLEKITVQIIVLLRSSPLFWTGIFALLIFSIGLKWFPLGGMRTPGSGSSLLSVDFLRHLALPCLVYAGYLVGLPALLLKERMEADLAKPYVDVVRAKGVRSSVIIYKHVLKNSMLPILTTAGAIIGIALGGQLAIEVVFSWPGLGRAIVKAIQTRDFAIAQAVFLIIGMMVVFANLLVDLSYVLVDPRVTHD